MILPMSSSADIRRTEKVMMPLLAAILILVVGWAPPLVGK